MKSRDGRIWCRHFVGVQKSGTCEAGITYKEQSWFGHGQDWPCHGTGTCPKYEPHTKDEIAKRDSEIEKGIKVFTVARPAIIDESVRLGFKKGEKSVQGEIACPCCEGGKLRFSRSSYNGHVHAHCSTEGCARWME